MMDEQPRALDLNPKKSSKRRYVILAHQDQRPKANPVAAKKGKGKTQLRAQTKFGAPLVLKPYEAPPYATEIEIRRRVGMIDDHYLARYPQIMDELVPWLAQQAEMETSGIGHDDVGDFLKESLELEPSNWEVADDLIKELVQANVLIEADSDLRIAGPEAGKPPPFTDAFSGARWALINMGVGGLEADERAEQLVEKLLTLKPDEDLDVGFDEGPLDEWLRDEKDGLFHEEGEFVPESGELFDKLYEANVILHGYRGGSFLFDPDVSGRSMPYVVRYYRQVIEQMQKAGADKHVLSGLREQLHKAERVINKAKYETPPTGRGKTKTGKRVPGAQKYWYDTRPVQDLVPGDVVYEVGPLPHLAAEVVSVEKGKGVFYTVTVRDGRGTLFTKRMKEGKMVALDKEKPEPEFVPSREVPRLRIDDPNILQLLSLFEGRDWMFKQMRFPDCPKCVFANKRAYEILISLGAKAKGLKPGHILDGGGRIQGSEKTGHWYEVDEHGHILVDDTTANAADLKAMQEVGIEAA